MRRWRAPRRPLDVPAPTLAELVEDAAEAAGPPCAGQAADAGSEAPAKGRTSTPARQKAHRDLIDVCLNRPSLIEERHVERLPELLVDESEDVARPPARALPPRVDRPRSNSRGDHVDRRGRYVQAAFIGSLIRDGEDQKDLRPQLEGAFRYLENGSPGTRDPHARGHREVDRQRGRPATLVRNEAPVEELQRRGTRHPGGGRSLRSRPGPAPRGSDAEAPRPPTAKAPPFPDFHLLVAEGKPSGVLSYERVNAAIPSDIVSPDKIEEVLTALQEEGIEVVDEEPAAASRFEKALPGGEDDADRDQAALIAALGREEEDLDDDLPLGYGRPRGAHRRPGAHVPDADGRDPAAHARPGDRARETIEIARRRYRQKVLESAVAASAAVKILEDVERGELAFDRTLQGAASSTRTTCPTACPRTSRRSAGSSTRNRTLFDEWVKTDGDLTKEARASCIRVDPQQPPQVRAARGGAWAPDQEPAAADGAGEDRRARDDRAREGGRDAPARAQEARDARGARTGSTRCMLHCAESPERLRRRVEQIRARFAEYEEAKRKLSSRQPAPRRLDREEVPQPRALVPGPDPGGQHRPDEGGREVRVPARLQVLDLRDVVDPPGDHALDRRPGADDPHPGPHDRDDEQAAQRHEEAAPEERAASRRSRRSRRQPASRSTRRSA